MTLSLLIPLTINLLLFLHLFFFLLPLSHTYFLACSSPPPLPPTVSPSHTASHPSNPSSLPPSVLHLHSPSSPSTSLTARPLSLPISSPPSIFSLIPVHLDPLCSFPLALIRYHLSVTFSSSSSLPLFFCYARSLLNPPYILSLANYHFLSTTLSSSFSLVTLLPLLLLLLSLLFFLVVLIFTHRHRVTLPAYTSFLYSMLAPLPLPFISSPIVSYPPPPPFFPPLPLPLSPLPRPLPFLSPFLLPLAQPSSIRPLPPTIRYLSSRRASFLVYPLPTSHYYDSLIPLSYLYGAIPFDHLKIVCSLYELTSTVPLSVSRSAFHSRVPSARPTLHAILSVIVL